MSDNIKVVVKVRPLISREIEEKLSYQWRVKNNTLHQLDQNGKDFGTCYTFDKVYDKDTKTSDIYNDIAKPIVEAATAGFNGTIFAYGQTSSGKTYTMTGTEDSPGIIPLAVYNLFQIIKNIPDRDFLVRVSYIEIYNETLRDLLNLEKKNVKIQETLQGLKVDCNEHVTTSPEELLRYLKEGEANRQTGATNMNEESSRSHSIFQITIESREHIEGEEEAGCVNVSQLNLVDLAGSERAGQTGATGLRFKEGTHINKSLSALALVIKQLSEDQTKHVNYRDSKLTRILQNSLGGNAKTSIICAITPAAVEETISTLQFANRAKAIKNKPEVNAVATDATMIQSLTKQLSKLQSQLESKKNLEVMLESKKNVEQHNYNLQKQIAALQKLILNGFGTRSSIDMMAGSRRKLVPPRRVTISALLPIEEDPVPAIPKFHTPLLKYNPMMIPGSNDFMPIQNASKLSSLPEEGNNRMITPPPPDKKVTLSDEIIDLDSDDDNCSTDVHPCSPYHQCYGASKTPPCVLRKNAKLAEKNLKDIVELTEREKVYAPNVVELIEKLEQNTVVISRLEDEVNALHKKSKNKDLEIEQLKVKVSKSNEEINVVNLAKTELEALCKEYTTKLTDSEFSYETLKAKTKRREDELLALLDEQKMHNNSKVPVKNFDKELNFMDMSKDISLVNSDNESSMTNINDDESTPQVQDLVTEIQNQLSSKNQSVLELEAEIFSQKQKILSLENSSRELQKTVDNFKGSMDLLENENSLLKSTIETLNSTIKSQKSTLESANNDIESYNSLIQELQIKLTDKEKISNLNINENTLEKMIANEEKFIANNENMKNIIHSFKIALESRNKEIESLKSVVEKNFISLDHTNLQEQLQLKENEIKILDEKVKHLQDSVNDNISLVNKLIEEKNNLKDVENQLATELVTISQQCEQLKKNNNEKEAYIGTLVADNEKLQNSITEKDNIEKELLRKHEDLTKNIEELSKNVLSLEECIAEKDNLIITINAQITQNQDYILTGNSILNILRSIISQINGSYQNESQSFERLDDIFGTLKDLLNILETSIIETKIQKDLEIKLNVEQYQKTNQVLKDENNALRSEHDNLRKELESKTNQFVLLETNVINYKDKNEQLLRENLSKENVISSLRVTECALKLEIDELKHEMASHSHDYRLQITNLTNELESKNIYIEDILSDKEVKIQHLERIEKSLQNKSEEVEGLLEKVSETVNSKNSLLDQILQQACKIINTLDIEFESNITNSTFDNIINALDSISKHTCAKNREGNGDAEDLLYKAQENLQRLGERNNELLGNISELDKTNKHLISQLEEIKLENHIVCENLNESNEVLHNLKLELDHKSYEMESMVKKTQELKEHFTAMDNTMKEQLIELQADNDKLRTKCSSIEILKDEIKHLQADNNELATRCSELEIGLNVGKSSTDIQNKDDDTEYNNRVNNSSYESIQTIENSTPPSLLTICCNKIIETIQPNDKSVTTSDSNTSNECSYVSKICNCDKLKVDLRTVQLENEKLLDVLEELQALNQNLIAEQNQVRQEVELLLQPAYELQKRINSHKTNLSTLTATTYAENKLLRSQVTVLQHHHSRFHKVCQRDLPVVKKQLHDLMTILQSDNSFSDKHNASFKRYSLPSVLNINNTTLNNLKNESTLDGDLLMLDTNLTLTTSADNTLMGLDQTCLDMTQVYPNNDVGCQTFDLTHLSRDHVENLENHGDIYERIEALEAENLDLREQVRNQEIKGTIDTHSSPIKMCDTLKCVECEDLKYKQQSLEERIGGLSQKLNICETQKKDFENKYNNLTLEIPTVDALLKRISIFEKELNSVGQEVTKLTNLLNSKNKELKELQQENDTLSTQVMENVSEIDDLNRELDALKDDNAKLVKKYNDLEKLLQETKDKENVNCSQCQVKDDVISSLENVELHSKLNRSLSDSDTSSRYNKICTLQNELHAGREDCKELTEEVTVIKKHLERNNLSMSQNMDLDDSMGESNIFSFTKNFDNVGSPLNKYSMSNTAPERQLDIYSADKIDCINYFVEKTGVDKENLDCNVKIIDIMKMFYTNCIMKHSEEVQNLRNKIKCFEDSRNQLEAHVNELSMEYTNVSKNLEEKEHNFEKVTNTLSQIRKITTQLMEEMSTLTGDDKKSQFVAIFKEKILKVMDNEFGFSSVTIFENLVDSFVNKHQTDLTNIMDKYTELQTLMNAVTSELNAVNDNLLQMKCQLSDKENEYNLLKAQKEKIHEISNAVTLDIVHKEKELYETIMNGCKKLVENNMMCATDIDMSLPLNWNINLLFDRLIKEFKDQSPDKESLALEIKKSRTDLDESQKALQILKVEIDKLKDINRTVTLDLVNKDKELNVQNNLQEELNKKYEIVVEENKSVNALIEQKKYEIKVLKESLIEKDTIIQNMEQNRKSEEKEEEKLAALIKTVASYKEEITGLKTINEVISKEKALSALELEKCKELLRTNTIELDKMTADILVLRESVKDNVSVIETLKQEAKSLLQQNIQLKENVDEKSRECSRLLMNIKTHEKTAEIQSKMIMRHQKQKEEDDKIISEKNALLEQLNQQIIEFKRDSELVKNTVKATKEQLEAIRNEKEALELRLSQTETDIERLNKPRPSIDPSSDTTRRRRQSIHDSKRMLSENQDFGDHAKAEALFESRSKPVDLFMDVDEDHSNRSTPLRNSRGRDSLSRHDQSDDPPSRPSSVAETRRRRQSIHDLHRTGVQQTPSPHERTSSKLNEVSRRSIDMDNGQSEISQLREKLAACQQELEELKEQYRELDDECETCGQYLRERDEQCARLKKEKTALQNLVSELKDKLQTINPNRSQQEPKVTFSDAAVNTDEDWTNLHSVVVDRMSFDAEVEKNKRLTKTIEELRFKKLDLKMTLAKMQKALEKSATRDHSKELEITKIELKACKQELEELKERYKELDDECTTCSEYLKERDEQCRRLKKDKAALESRLQEYAECRGDSEARRRRRSAHDQARAAAPLAAHAATQVTDDFLNNQVDRDENSKRSNDDKSKELRRLKMVVEKLSQQKTVLEQQLLAASTAPAPNPMYIATGSAIVQNQQLTDVMKENQKLKKINTKLIDICKKRGKKPDVTNEDLSEQALGP